MTLKKLTLAGAFLAPLFFAQPAEAREYCREYQKTITVGGRYESGYGTACMQPDGAWMIVESRGSVDPFDDLRRQNVILISDQRPVYYPYGPAYRPVTYYPRKHHRHYYKPYYYGRPTSGLSFSFIFDDDDNRRRHWDRHDWRRDEHRGRGHGHHHGRGRGHDRD